MEMWVLMLAVIFCYVSILQACMVGFRYIPPTVPSEKTKRLKNETDCGRIGANQDKIVGGAFALENEFPWHVALFYRIDGIFNTNGCGGFLLSCDPVIVVTAAHCVAVTAPPDLSLPIPLPAKILQVAFGAHILDAEKLGKNEIRLDVEEIILHPSFVRYTVHAGVSQHSNINVSDWENDIAVLKVKTDSGFQCKKDTIWPACLPRKENKYADYMGVVTGWGEDGGGNRPKTLKKAMVSIASNEECGSKNKLCAIDREAEDGPCGGDSGGPLVVKDVEEDAWSAVGIVSYGPSGCNASQYEVYTRVEYYLEWISDQFGLLPPI